MSRQQTAYEALVDLDRDWPGLRTDVQMHPVQPGRDGRATWVVEDPVGGRYFSVGETEFVLVDALRDGARPTAALQALRRFGLAQPTTPEYAAFLRQLREAGLCRGGAGGQGGDPRPGDVNLRTASGPGWRTRLLHGYVYYRVPLLRPDAALTWLAPLVRPLAARQVARMLQLAGLLGLLLALPQAELYFATASYLLTPAGFLGFVGCLVALKIGHELAHAFSAKFKNLHVRSMGVAFILLWPILYTDVTDAWLEPDRRRRAQIGSAGIRFELAVAALALLAWAVLPDGIARSLAFYLSSASILSTLLINLNPFMRFDGYFLLMDVWGIDNLQPRAFALLRHGLRRLCLGWRGGSPEHHPQAVLMRAYALATLAYRVLVAVGIAAAVFGFFGPVAGLLIAALEVYILLVRPLLREVREVHRQRRAIGSPLRAGVSVAVLAGLAAAVFLPLDRSLAVPALLTHERLQYVGAPFAGRIVQLPPAPGQVVVAGQALLVVDSPERSHERARIELELRRNRAEQQALDTRGSEGGYRRWLEEDERRLLAKRERAVSRLAQLVVTASAPGEVVERAADFQPGDTVAADQVLATVRQSARLRVHAYVPDLAGARLDPRTVISARLLAWDRGLPMFAVPVVDASLTPLDRLPTHALYDRYGGPMVAVAERPGQGSPVSAAASAPAGPPLRPRDVHQAFSFSVDLPALAARIPETAPAWVELRLEPVSLARRFFDFIVRELSR